MTTAQAALLVSGVAATIALYGAMNAHRALRWQRRRDEERSETRVRAHFEHASWHDDDLAPGALAMIGGPENLPLEYRLTLVVVNESEQATVYVRDLYIQDAADTLGVHLTYDEDEDTRLEPHERMARQLFLSQTTIDLAGGLVGKARLSTDEWIETEVEHLMPELLHDIEERNTRGRLDGPPGDD